MVKKNNLVQTSRKTNTHEARNFKLAVINGIFIHIGFTFIDSSMVLAAFVKKLTGSNLLVGLTNSTMRAGWMWPQLLTSNLLEHKEKKMPFYILGASMRILGWIIIMILTLIIGNSNYMALFICFYIVYFLATSAVGISSLPFNDILAKEIPIYRRARLFGIRQLIGSFFAIWIGFLIRYMLSDRFFLKFPYNYSIMFALSAFFLSIATFAFAITKEPVEPVHNERKPLWEHLKLGPYFLKTDRNYRYFLGYRILASFGNMGIPFYVPFAIDKLGIHPSFVGAFTTVGAISAILSNILWGYVGEKFGSRSLLFYTSILSFIAPLVAASTGFLPGSYQIAYYFLVFIITQFFASGSDIAYMTYTLGMAPSAYRPTYIGFLNTLIFPMSFVPFLAGAMLKIMPYELLFVISSVISIIAIYFTFNLANVDRVKKVEK